MAMAVLLILSSTACAFQGVNSLPLPGAVGRGSGASVYHVHIPNVVTLESNSPVMIGDVIVGSVGTMRFTDWHADVEVSLKPDIVVPANAVANVGQTSLLGSMHLSLDPPVGQAAIGRLAAGSTIELNRSSTYPSTEQTLASLSSVVNGGALGQIGDIIHNVNSALDGRQPQIRDLLTRLNTIVSTLDSQRDNIIAAMEALDRLADTFAAQTDVLARALDTVPPALDVLLRERPKLITALDKLSVLSDTATRLVNDTQDDLVTNLRNIEPTIRALGDVGPELATAVAYATTFPFSQNVIDRAVRGDYFNVFAAVDLTVPRLKRTLFLGTRWGEEGAVLVPAPGDPWYLNYTKDPLQQPIAEQPAAALMPAPANSLPPLLAVPGTASAAPILPVVPPPTMPSVAPGDVAGHVFAGPYDVSGVPPSAVPQPAGGR